MTKEFFKNLPDTSTPLNASRLNGLLNGNESMGNIVVEDVKCKNLFNINALTLQAGSVNKSSGTITVNQYSNGSNQTLKTLAPDLVAGKTYTFSFKTTGSTSHIYLSGSQSTWKSGTAKVVTQEELNNTINFYGEWENSTEVIISEIQIEEGTAATEYTPYKGISYTSGRNENGSWIKYEDGTMICCGTITYDTIDCTEEYGSLYYGAVAWQYPNTFVELPTYINGTMNWGGIGGVALASTTSSVANLYVYNAMSYTANNAKMKYIAIGRWK